MAAAISNSNNVIIIRAGFTKIDVSNVFVDREGNERKETIRKGQELAEAKHILHVQERQEEGKVTITGKCIRQQSIATKTPFNVEIQVHPVTRKWLSGRCGPDCPTGGDGRCKHSAALAYTINTERTEACTDDPSKWQTPSKTVQDIYPKGLTVEELYAAKCTTRSSTRPNEDKLKDVAEELAKFGLTNSSLFKTVTADTSPEMEIEIPLPSTEVKKMFHEQETDPGFNISNVRDPSQLNEPAKSYYMEHIAISDPELYINMFQETLEQAEDISGQWKLLRSCRISASQANKIHRARTPQTVLSHFNKKLVKHPNLDYGIENEVNARRKFTEVTSYEVEKCGLIVSHRFNWLCGSPDGIFVNAAGERVLIEIKCPSSCAGSKINVSWVKNSQIKQTHEYFCQVQLLMYLTRTQKCNFFIWSDDDYLLLEIPLDLPYV